MTVPAEQDFVRWLSYRYADRLPHNEVAVSHDAHIATVGSILATASMEAEAWHADRQLRSEMAAARDDAHIAAVRQNLALTSQEVEA